MNQHRQSFADNRESLTVDELEEQERTFCSQIENYQMPIKTNKFSINFQEKSLIASESGKSLADSQYASQGNLHFQGVAQDYSTSLNNINREKVQLLSSLKAQFRKEKSASSINSQFSIVTNLLNKIHDNSQAHSGGKQNKKASKGSLVQKRSQNTATKIISCIFKVNDDLRQDILALQVIKLFQKIFKKCDLDLYVVPYKCISNRTGDDRMLGGIIECIPNSYSRD